jgi:hypothetical protein
VNVGSGVGDGVGAQVSHASVISCGTPPVVMPGWKTIQVSTCGKIGGVPVHLPVSSS